LSVLPRSPRQGAAGVLLARAPLPARRLGAARPLRHLPRSRAVGGAGGLPTRAVPRLELAGAPALPDRPGRRAARDHPPLPGRMEHRRAPPAGGEDAVPGDRAPAGADPVPPPLPVPDPPPQHRLRRFAGSRYPPVPAGASSRASHRPMSASLPGQFGVVGEVVRHGGAAADLGVVAEAPADRDPQRDLVVG